MKKDQQASKADDGYKGDDPKLIKVPAGLWHQANEYEEAAAKLARASLVTGEDPIMCFVNTTCAFEHVLLWPNFPLSLGQVHVFNVAEVYDGLNWLQLNLAGMQLRGTHMMQVCNYFNNS